MIARPSRVTHGVLCTSLALCGLSLLAFAIRPHRPSPVFAAEASLENPDAVCATCHKEIYDHYERTQMARGSGLASDDLIPGNYHHKLSGVDYSVFARDGAAWMSFNRPATDQRGGLSGERRLEYFIGSGAEGRTYLYQQDGQWFELPINFYHQRNACPPPFPPMLIVFTVTSPTFSPRRSRHATPTPRSLSCKAESAVVHAMATRHSTSLSMATDPSLTLRSSRRSSATARASSVI